jgi:glutamine amidotransferase
VPHKKSKSVAVVDYDAGNLFSVEHACKSVGMAPVIISRPEEIRQADALILPGVGAFGDAMNNLRRLDLVRPLKDFIASGKPFMGICLGMQLLFSRSEEFGDHEGLNLIDGDVVKFPTVNGQGQRNKIPQIGWNRITSPSKSGEPWHETPLEPIADGEFMYFIHSFYAKPRNPEYVLALTDYGGIRYCSAVMKDNIFATQFHPEKSAAEGIKIYQYWSSKIHRE